MEVIKDRLLKVATSLEILVAFFIVVAIVIGALAVIRYLGILTTTGSHEIYDEVKTFLSLALLLVIGVELVLMLLTHSVGSILELVLFAIARKMLVYSETMVDLILGTLAIALVFAVRKYLLTSQYMSDGARGPQVLSADLPITAINFDEGLHIPEDKGTTLGGLICHLSEETCIPVEEGAEYKIGDVRLKIVSMKQGLIEKVMVMEEGHEIDEKTGIEY